MLDRGCLVGVGCLDISRCGQFGRIGCENVVGVLYARVCARVSGVWEGRLGWEGAFKGSGRGLGGVFRVGVVCGPR